MSSDPNAMSPESRNPAGPDGIVRPLSANAPREWRGIEEFSNQSEFLAAREGELRDSDLPNAPVRLVSPSANATPNAGDSARPRPWEAWLRHADLREQLSQTQNLVQLAPAGSPKPPQGNKDGIDRRDLLKIMAATAATAGLSACTILPDEHIVPYVRQPEDVLPGKPLFYATSMTQQGVATGLLVESHMGRPTKIEGNPEHPGSLGGTDIYLQASVLGVYDPARSQTVLYNGNISGWDQFVAEMHDHKAALASGGEGLYLLTETVTSPSFSAQLQKLQKQFPKAKWHQYEPCHRDSAFEGARLAFGKPVNTVYRFDQANVVVSLDSDFLVSGPGHVRHARDFSSRRSIDGTSQNLNRLYTAESMPTSTGAMADHRFRMRTGDVEAFARQLAAAIGIALPGGTTQSAVSQETVQAIARDLTKNRGASLVIAGEQQPPAVHALAHAMNDALQNVGKTVYYTQPLEVNPVNQTDSLHELVNDLNAGKVKLLIILGGNPIYNAPADFNFESALMKAPLRVYWGLYKNETGELCNWHVPATHYLESWGDAPGYDGTIGIQQPLIAPLYGGHSDYELIATLTGDDALSTHDIVKGYWQAQGAPKGQNFEDFWQITLHDGVLANTALQQISVPLKRDFLQQPSTASPVQANETELTFRADPTIFDGRWANNFWLQEIPKPITRITWDNAVMMSPATAGQHKLNHGDYVTLRCGGREVSGGVFLAIGHADNAITVHLGYGRQRMYTPHIEVGPGGDMGKDAELGPVYGFNGYALRTSTAPWIANGPVQITNTGKKYTFATVQYQYLINNNGVESDDESVNAFRRELVQVATLDEFKRDPNFAQVPESNENKSLSLYHNYDYSNGYSWGLAIDLNKCVGCNACVVACVSENNIATVGKDEVDRGRSMHWIRIDTYFHGGVEAPEMYFEPVPCMQCENAPCEYVCPVGATTHSAEGLNDMTYNRCVGTRYCSNNCPYKVRRFNFFLFSDYTTPSLYGVRNPNVTVRSRGVMEKCTYCVQRINAAKIRSAEEDRIIRDLEIQTACQQACPAGAIMFGNINDKNAHVTRWKAQPRNYTLLADLNTRPRTTYLARVRNPNPEIAG